MISGTAFNQDTNFTKNSLNHALVVNCHFRQSAWMSKITTT